MFKKYLFAASLILLLLLPACARLEPEPPKMGGVSIISQAIDLGEPGEQQVVKYSVTVLNGTGQEVQIDWVKPLISEPFKAMVGDQKLALELKQKLPAETTLVVSGEFVLKTNGIPKDTMAKMGPLVTGFQVSSRQSFNIENLPSQHTSK